MLIICPSCATSYRVKPDILGMDGRSVRCVRCETVWRTEPPRAQRLLAAAEAIGPQDTSVAAVSELPRFAEAAAARPAAGQGWAAGPEPDPWDQHQPPDEDAAHQAGPEGQSLYDEATLSPDAAPPEPGNQYAVEAVDLDAGRPMVLDAAPNAPKDIESFVARRTRRAAGRRRAQWPLSRLQTTIVALIVINSMLIGWRSDVVRLLPQTASFYALIGLPVNLRGLSFDGVDVVKEEHEGVPVLVVEGHIVNDARRTLEVPRLKFAVRNASGQEVYSWTASPPRPVLSPGEAIAFRSRLASPPPETRDILVRFLNRRDLVANMR
jgi:predicted Zn finger-like uncharacterized protein